MPYPGTADLAALVRRLVDGRVEFIVVGGAAAVLHGAMVTTQDLDIVPQLTPQNLARLEAVLAELDAVIREPGERRLRPDAGLLAMGGQVLLRTTDGPMDIIGRLHDGRGFEALLDSFGGSERRPSFDSSRRSPRLSSKQSSKRIAPKTALRSHLLALLRDREKP